MSTFISYHQLLKDRWEFRKSGGKYSTEFNFYDAPSHKYFKLFFYFYNGDSDKNISVENCTGLLAQTWQADDFKDYGLDEYNMTASYRPVRPFYKYNSAWSYFMMNNDITRADVLKKFIILLSNISSESPWYFSELTGLDSAMDRKTITMDNFTILPERPKITIKCLPDAVDDRIGTLLDLYRYMVWDWVSKRETLPANLRKFDMGILIFDSPVAGLHATQSNPTKSDDYEFKNINTGYYNIKNRTSFKYIELHNCEIDYNSTKTAYVLLNNKEGSSVEYNIDIHFDDCFETRVNEFMPNEYHHNFPGILFGDILNSDNVEGGSHYGDMYDYRKYDARESDDKISSILGAESVRAETIPFNTRIGSKIDGKSMMTNGINNEPWKTALKKGEKNFVQKYLGGAINEVADFATQTIKKAVLGNLYTFSLSNIADSVKKAMSGDYMGVVSDVVAMGKKAQALYDDNLGSLLDITDNFNDMVDPITGKPYKKHGKFGDKHAYQNSPEIGKLSENKYEIDKANETENGGNVSYSPTFIKEMDEKMKPHIYGYDEHDINPDNAFKDNAGYKGKTEYKNQIGKIMQDDTLETQLQMKQKMGTMLPKKIIKPTVKKIGNLVQGNTIANNL